MSMGMTSLIAIKETTKVESDFTETAKSETDFAEKSVKCAKLYIVVDDYPFIIYYI
jgi:hypothetical protein